MHDERLFHSHCTVSVPEQARLLLLPTCLPMCTMRSQGLPSNENLVNMARDLLEELEYADIFEPVVADSAEGSDWSKPNHAAAATWRSPEEEVDQQHRPKSMETNLDA